MKRTILYLIIILLSSYKLNAQADMVIQTGHSNAVISLAISPDGKYLVTGSFDHTAILWDIQSGKEIRRFTGYKDAVKAAAFSPDGKYLFTASYGDAVVKMWEYSSGREIRNFKAQTAAIAVSCDGKYLIACDDKILKLWDINSGKEVKKLTKDAASVTSMALSPDGKYLATGGLDKLARLWDMKSGKEIRNYTGHSKNIWAVAYSPDGKYLATGSDDETIKLWDVQSGKEIRSFAGAPGVSPISVAFSPDGKYLAATLRTGTAKLWDVKSGEEFRSFTGHTDYLASLAFSPDGNYLFTGSGDKSAKMWDINSGQEIRRFAGNISSIKSLTFRPDGKFLLSGGYDKAVKLWDLQNGKQRIITAGHRYGTFAMAVSPDSKLLATGGYEPVVKLWDMQTAKEIRSFSGHTGMISTVEISPDGKYLAAGGEDKSVILWDMETGQQLRSLTGHTNMILSMAFSPEGKTLVTSCIDGTDKLWDVNTGQELKSISEENSNATELTLSRDGRYLFTAGYWDKKAKMRDLKTGEELRSFTGHTGYLRSIALSPDEKYLATGSYDKTVKLWEAKSGKEIRTFTDFDNTVNSVIFSQDGKFLYTGDENGIIKIWDLNTGKELISLFSFEGSAWAAKTPDGRFDGSAEGIKLVNFVQGLNVIPLESFFEKFYTPNLLARVLSGEDKPQENAALNLSSKVKLPPMVNIISPKVSDDLNSESLKVTVEAVDQGGGIDEVKLYLNGKVVTEDERGMKSLGSQNRKITKTFQVSLLPGINTIKATAFNTDRTESVPAEIKVELKSAEVLKSDLYLISIGINKYKNGKYNLNYGRTDAEDFSKMAAQKGKDIFRDIKSFNIYDEDAVKENVIKTISGIVENSKPGDTFILYYAGHGVMSEGSPQDPADFYIVPFDITQMYGSSDMLKERGISAKELKEMCSKIKAQKQVIILDACQSGGAIETFAMRGAQEEKAILQLARSTGVAVLASTGTDQYAAEFSKLGHGLFTYALLQGLDGKADGNPGDGKITVRELESYLNDTIPELTKQFRGETQYPYGYSRGMDFPLGVK